MTFRTSITSKGDPGKILRRGFKSMFANYDPPAPEVPPVDTQGGNGRTKKTPSA